MNFINKYGLLIVLIITILSFVNGCGNNIKSSKLQVQVDSLRSELSSLKQTTITSDQMLNILRSASTGNNKPVNITIKK